MSVKSPKYLSTKQVADILGISQVTARRWRVEKKGPPYQKIGWLCKYEIKAFYKWIEQKCVIANGD
jgi:predicted site-specific integrase-resolvase